MDEFLWLLFVAQLPAHPSSARVQLWRHLRVSGAVSLQNGVWVLPAREAHEQLLRNELAQIERQGGSGQLFQAQALGRDLVARFHDDRDQEYAEVCELSQALRDELAREARAGKETFAELEENEQELAKLERWLTQIQARDFFGAPAEARAAQEIEACRVDLAAFAVAVYRREGVVDATADEADGTEETERASTAEDS
jgi:ChrB-like protein